MKILQVCNHFYPCTGGIERVVFDISRLLAENGHTVKVVCLDRCAGGKEKLPTAEKAGKVEVERIGFLDFKYYKIAPQILGKLRGVDVVHVHGIGFFSDFLLLTKPIHRKRVVVSTHGGVFHTKTMAFAKWVYFNLAQRLILGLADKVIAVSRNDYELFSGICTKTALIENGIDLSNFKPGKKKPGTLLYLGRFSKNKRVDLIIDAFAKLKGGKFKLTIAGTDGEGLLKKYREKAEALGLGKKLEFALNPSGQQATELYSQSEFFVSASEYEGFGIALIEAMASGCIPVVQTNPGFAAILGEKHGFLADYPDSAAEKISKAYGESAANKDKLKRIFIAMARKYSWGGKILMLEKAYGD